MKKWEYKIHVLKTLSIEEELNRLGEDGWELIAVEPETEDNFMRFYLKREKQVD